MKEEFTHTMQLYKELEDNVVFTKALDFAVRIVNLYKYLQEECRETVMSKQVLRSGTSIGANISEALGAESKDDFIHKFSISFKEGNETKFWLLLLHRTNFITDTQFESMISDCQDLRKLMGAIIRTSKKQNR